MNIFRLLQIHLELECITFDHRGDLLFMPCPEPDVMPRVYIGQHTQGYITLFHHDLDPALRNEINAIAPELALREPNRVKQILERAAPCNKIGQSKSYIFQRRVTPDLFPDVVRVGPVSAELFADPSRINEQPSFAIERDGEIVSVCESARENKSAGQAWVRTNEAYRRRGYARQTVMAWAHDLQSRNKIPFYSHKIENIQAEAFAVGLGIGHWITDVAFS